MAPRKKPAVVVPLREHILSKRKQASRDHADQMAARRATWRETNSAFHDADKRYFSFLVTAGKRVLDLGCGNGELLASLRPSYGVGVDLSENMVDEARHRHPSLEFVAGDIEDPAVIESLDGPFDIIIMSDTVGYLDDCQKTFEQLHAVCTPTTRLIIAYHNWMWQPGLKLAEKLGLKMPTREMNWLSTDETTNFLELADFEAIKREWRQMVPKKLFGLGPLVNNTIATLPLARRACVRNYLVARPTREVGLKDPSVTVLIPTRNERGNVEPAVLRTPQLGSNMELLFVEGHSQDGTLAEIHRIIEAYPDKNIRVLTQDGVGKGDAVRKGFANAKGDVLMILDGDLTVPPEDLPKFWDAIVSGKGEYINGSRLVYPMEDEAMRFLNYIANSSFSVLFSWLLNQRITDTLCGTKVMTRANYEQLIANRDYFGEFDPFGDFDLIFGASKMGLKMIDVPITYAARQYGSTQISRFRHGLLLFKMVGFAYRKLKIV